MNPVVEKLAAIEKEVAAIQPKMAPLTERISALDQKVADFAQQLTGIAEESASVKQDIELTQQCLARIQTLISESKVESEQLVAGQEENLQRCETMTAVFGAAFQAVSQFFETAQRMGLADQAKAVFLTPPSNSIPSAPIPAVPPASESPPAAPDEPVIEAAPAEEPAIPEPPMVETPEPDNNQENMEAGSEATQCDQSNLPSDPVTPAAPALPTVTSDPEFSSESQIESPEPIAEAVPVIEPAVTEPPIVESPEPKAELLLTESDFDSVMSDANTGSDELASWSVADLPDVATPPVMEAIDSDADSFAGAEPSSEMASQLDVPPLNLGIPDLSEQSEAVADGDSDEDDIEAMLASMMAPVTATAGG